MKYNVYSCEYIKKGLDWEGKPILLIWNPKLKFQTNNESDAVEYKRYALIEKGRGLICPELEGVNVEFKYD